MNYPFKKKKSLSRLLSLTLVLLMTMAMLSGCSLLPGSSNTEPSTEATEPSSDIPNIVETDPPTEPSTVPTTAATEPKKDNIAVVKEQINIRSAPSTGSRVVTDVDAGEELEVLRIESIGNVTWAYVSSDTLNIMGWVTTDMLDMSNVKLATGGTTTPGSTDSSTPTTAGPPTPPPPPPHPPHHRSHTAHREQYHRRRFPQHHPGERQVWCGKGQRTEHPQLRQPVR